MSPSLLCGETEVQDKTKHRGKSIQWERLTLCLPRGLKEGPQQDTDDGFMVGGKRNGSGSLAEDELVWRS